MRRTPALGVLSRFRSRMGLGGPRDGRMMALPLFFSAISSMFPPCDAGKTPESLFFVYSSLEKLLFTCRCWPPPSSPELYNPS